MLGGSIKSVRMATSESITSIAAAEHWEKKHVLKLPQEPRYITRWHYAMADKPVAAARSAI